MSLDEYINVTRACPSVFAAVNVVEPSVDNDQIIENTDKQVEMDANDEEESNILKDKVQLTGMEERGVLCKKLNSSQREEVGDQQVERGDDKEEVEDEEDESTHLPPVV
jgi:Zn-dependent metalloprotease